MLEILQRPVVITATLIVATIILLPTFGQETSPETKPNPLQSGDPAVASKAEDEVFPDLVDDAQSSKGGDEIPDRRETRRENTKKPSTAPISSLFDGKTKDGSDGGYYGGASGGGNFGDGGFGGGEFDARFGGGAAGGSLDTGMRGGESGNSRLIQGSSIMISFSELNDELRGFSHTTGEWAHLKIEPQKRLIPVVSDTVGAVRVGDTMAAYSGLTGSWDVLQLSKNSKAVPVVGRGLVQATDGERHYTFAAANGKWTSPNDPRFRTAPATSRKPRLPLAARPGLHRNPLGSNPFDQDTVDLAKQFRGRGLDDSQARAAMTASVAAAFDRRQQSQREEARRLQQKLEKINAALQTRERLRHRIIERRVEELLDPAIDWDDDDFSREQLHAPGLDPGITPSAMQLGLPPAGLPMGLPGPPHLPYGGQAAQGLIQANPNTSSGPGVRSSGDQPSEITQRLYDRQRLTLQTADLLRDAQAELKELRQPLSVLASV